MFAHLHRIAVVGASATPGKPGHDIPAYLQEQGYEIVPVNPSGREILGRTALRVLEDLEAPASVDVVLVFRPATEAPGITRQAIAIGARGIWLQEGIVSHEAAALAHAAGVPLVMDRCMGVTHGELGLGPGPHAACAVPSVPQPIKFEGSST